MKNYVLVHGGWEGSFFWEEVKPILTQKGNQVKLVDLPGSYGNKQPIDKVTLESCVAEAIKVINEFDGKVILVGHSLAGVVITAVAERIPEKFEKLIYIGAPLLRSGESVIEILQNDKEGQLLPKVVFSEDQSYAMVDEKTWREVALHDVKEKTIQKILPKMADKQATQPFMTKVNLSEEKFGSVSKVYIKTAYDRVMSPASQDRMIEGWPVEKVHTLESGHFPGLSVPEKLAEMILEK